jgi:flagellar secretion chaperone FliS
MGNRNMFTSVATRSVSAYKRVGIETSVDGASPHQLISLLFDALIQSLGVARSAIASGEIAVKGRAICKAVRILEEGLAGVLNREDGGEVAVNLSNLYRYCSLRLTQANVANDDAMVAEVQRLIEPVAQSWKQIEGAAGAPFKPM